MPLNRDDIISEVTVSGSAGITCNRAELIIEPVTRTIRVNFMLSKITVLADGKFFDEPIMPVSVDLTDGTNTKTFKIYNRRTGAPVPGVTKTYDAMTRDLMSLFFDTAASSGVA